MNETSVYEGSLGQLPAAQAEAADRIMFIAKVYLVFFTGVVVYFASIIALFAGYMADVPAVVNLVVAMALFAP